MNRMADITKTVLQINGVKYPITTPESEAYVQELGRELDRTVRQLMSAGRVSITQAMMLACLSYLDAYKKAEQGADNLRSQIAEYLEEAAKARLEAGEARKELARLEARLKNREGKG